MKINKSNTLTSSITLLGLGILAFLFTFGLAVVDQESSVANLGFLGEAKLHFPIFKNFAANCILYLLLPIPGILCFVRGRYDYQRAVNTRKDEMNDIPKSVWSKFALFTRYSDFITNIIFTVVFFALAVLCIYVLSRLKLSFTVFTLLYLIPIVLYFPLRSRFSKGLKTAANKLRKGYPSYTLSEDSIEMRLYPVGKSKRAVNPPPVRLNFNELDEVKILNDVETENYMKYSLGPDLSLSQKMIEGKIRYLKGEIARPPVFRSATCTNSLSLLFRGRNLFYLITFETDEVDDIEKAYKAYRQIHSK